MAERTIRADVKGLAEGEIRLAGSGDDKAILLRHGGELRAFAATCPHYGAPLEKGLVCDGKLVCPWHKASFDAGNGALIEPPALDGLARYPVEIDGDTAIVTLKPMDAATGAWDGEADEDEGTFGIVGTGAAGMAAARALREFGFAGRIVMIGQEEGTPYDRPALSKDVPAGKLEPEDASLKSSFYQDNAIDFRHMAVEIIDVEHGRVGFRDGAGLNCDALLIASGATPKLPDLPGAHLGNVLVLRSQEDARHLAEAAKAGHKVVIMGASFIGLEVATGLAKRGLKVDVVAPDDVPFAKQFGPEIGAALKATHEKNGVTFHMKNSIEQLEGEGDVARTVLKDGSRLDADFVLIAVGVQPATDMIRGVERLEDGSLAVDEYLSVAPDVFAAGDIASFPDPRSGGRARIEHWRLAEQLGRCAAANMLGQKRKFTAVPFFWTQQCGQRYDYAGYAPGWDEVILHGDPAKPDFIAYYVKGGKVLAALAARRDRQMIAFMHLLEAGRLPDAAALKGRDIDLTSLLD